MQTIGEYPRRVRFLIASDSLTAGEIAEALSISADDEAVVEYWEISVYGTGADDVTLMIEEVPERLQPALPSLMQIINEHDDVHCLLRVVQYISDDPAGPGFALSRQSLALLAQLRAFVDVDQYFTPLT